MPSGTDLYVRPLRRPHFPFPRRYVHLLPIYRDALHSFGSATPIQFSFWKIRSLVGPPFFYAVLSRIIGILAFLRPWPCCRAVIGNPNRIFVFQWVYGSIVPWFPPCLRFALPPR